MTDTLDRIATALERLVELDEERSKRQREQHEVILADERRLNRDLELRETEHRHRFPSEPEPAPVLTLARPDPEEPVA